MDHMISVIFSEILNYRSQILYRWKEKSIVCAIFFVVPLIVGLIVPYFLLRESIYRHRMILHSLWLKIDQSNYEEQNFDFQPFRIRSISSVESGSMPGWFSPVSSISTGLLFGVSLLHLIPDCTTDMQNALERNGFNSNYIQSTPIANIWEGEMNPNKCKCQKCIPSYHAFDINWLFHRYSCWNSCISMPKEQRGFHWQSWAQESTF